MVVAGLEWIIVIAVILIVFFGGGKKIVDFARSLGRASGEFKRGRQEIEEELNKGKKKKVRKK